MWVSLSSTGKRLVLEKILLVASKVFDLPLNLELRSRQSVDMIKNHRFPKTTAEKLNITGLILSSHNYAL
jgi:hypothetical protein